MSRHRSRYFSRFTLLVMLLAPAISPRLTAGSGAAPKIRPGVVLHSTPSVVSADTAAASESGAQEGGHHDPVAPLAISLVVILVSAKIGGHLATRIGQPAVLGELVMGVMLGNLAIFGGGDIAIIKSIVEIPRNEYVGILASIGVLLLLFEVGLESTVDQMLKVGVSSLLVATFGVIAPFALGWGVGAWLLPDAPMLVHAFLGAALSATSVGITARVLQDLGSSKSTEARIVLGAAVIDDVFGLVILAVVTAAVTAADGGEAVSTFEIGVIIAKATAFLVGALALGRVVSTRLFSLGAKLQAQGVLLALGLSFCFLLSWIAYQIGLAPIVGAFAAGLILEDVHFRDFTIRGELSLEHLVHPIASFLTPIFFVLMGMGTDLRTFGDPTALMLAAALTLAAIIGKQVCSFGVVGGAPVDRLTIGIGMIPRGEVGLIFASIGKRLTLNGKPVLTGAMYSAVVLMVIITTMITPPALKWSLERYRSRGKKTD